jgi:phage-related protein
MGLGRQIRGVQNGEFPKGAKWWSPGVMQLKEKSARTILTVEFAGEVWVVHAFDKDSQATRKQHKDLVKSRLKVLRKKYTDKASIH